VVGNQPKILITRAREDAVPLAALLNTHGIETRIDPMLEIELIGGPPLDLSGVQALLMTSANGVRAFCERNRERHLAVYSVGDATGREAENQGFECVHSAAGDVGDLAALLIANEKTNSGAFLHTTGTAVAGELGKVLEGAGYAYRREVLYQAIAAAELSSETKTEIEAGQLAGVTMYSPRTAGIFCERLKGAGLESCATAMTAFCLSPAVGEKVSEIHWRDIKIAKEPTQSSLLEIVLDSV